MRHVAREKFGIFPGNLGKNFTANTDEYVVVASHKSQPISVALKLYAKYTRGKSPDSQ